MLLLSDRFWSKETLWHDKETLNTSTCRDSFFFNDLDDFFLFLLSWTLPFNLRAKKILPTPQHTIWATFSLFKKCQNQFGQGGSGPPQFGQSPKERAFFPGTSSLYMTYCQWMADKLKHSNSWSCYIIIEFECWSLIVITLWICFRLNETKTAAHPIALHNSCDWLRLQSVLCDWSPVK